MDEKTDEGVWRVVCEDGRTHEVAVTPQAEGSPWRADYPPAGGSAVGRTPRGAVMVIVRLAQWKVAEILAPGQKTRAEMEAEVARLRAELDALKEEPVRPFCCGGCGGAWSNWPARCGYCGFPGQ